MAVSLTEAKPIALQFLLEDLEIPDDDQDFFCILDARETGNTWYVVEIGVEGLPDKWVLQVFDTGQCDPCYTFVSPMPAEQDDALNEFPDRIAEVLTAARMGQM
ncbi:MAG: hypothetical protein VKJ64_00530 [Leptolyngbyaceae bacterium]|nr:hypothetical protein [Leptolyngbyaceae bacterium]